MNPLPAGSTLYYRAFAISGTSRRFTEQGQCVTLPPAPMALNATNIASASFYANWTSASGASGYTIDVANDAAFLACLAGYSNSPCGNALTLKITGMHPSDNTAYCRIRATNESGSSANSGTITVLLRPFNATIYMLLYDE